MLRLNIVGLIVVGLFWPWLLHATAHLSGEAKCGKKWPACM